MVGASNEAIEEVIRRLDGMRREQIWPNGPRYLWTDAFGLVLLVSLHRATGEARWRDEALQLVADVDAVLGRLRGYRIGEAPDRDGQYFHYLVQWMHALNVLGTLDPAYRQRAIALARDVHEAFVVPGLGVRWKMREDLSGPYPGSAFGSIDPFHGLVVYRMLDEQELAHEILDLQHLVDSTSLHLFIDQDLGLGMMLWLSHFFTDELWSRTQRARALLMLEESWIETPGYFARTPDMRDVKYAFTNHGISIGLQSIGAWPGRVRRIRETFDAYRSGDHHDSDAITHVMACSAILPGLLFADELRAAMEGPSRARVQRDVS